MADRIKSRKTYVYLGGNDVDTASEIAKRCDLPLKKILYMPVETSWIFRRGEMPSNVRNFDLNPLLEEKALEIKRIKSYGKQIEI